MTRVLIIDDSKTIQKLVASCVTSLGATVAGIAGDGEEGVSLFNSLKPDLVLLDITMPNKDGRECLKEIMVSNPRATVVMLSALSSEEIIKECLALGAKAFLDKTVISQKEVLETELKRYIKGDQAA